MPGFHRVEVGREGGNEHLLSIKCLQAPVPRSWFLIPFPNERKQGFLEKQPMLRLGQGIVKMSVKEMLNKTKHNDGGHIKGKQETLSLIFPINRRQWPKLEQSEQPNK